VNRRALKKRLFLTILIYILSAGIVLANSGFLLVCCKHCERQSQHHGSKSSGHDQLHDCSPSPENSPCHCQTNFNGVVQNVDRSTEFMKEGFTAFNLAAAASSAISNNRTNHCFAYLKTLPIKIPPVPLYLCNLSLLF
jgi:hypothetical protein